MRARSPARARGNLHFFFLGRDDRRGGRKRQQRSQRARAIKQKKGCPRALKPHTLIPPSTLSEKSVEQRRERAPRRLAGLRSAPREPTGARGFFFSSVAPQIVQPEADQEISSATGPFAVRCVCGDVCTCTFVVFAARRPSLSSPRKRKTEERIQVGRARAIIVASKRSPLGRGDV